MRRPRGEAGAAGALAAPGAFSASWASTSADAGGATLPAGDAHLLDGAGEPAECFPVGPRLPAQGACFGLPRLAVGAGFFMKPVTLLLPCFQVGAVFGLGRQFIPARIPVPFPPEPSMSLEIRKSTRVLLGRTRNAV